MQGSSAARETLLLNPSLKFTGGKLLEPLWGA